ncbi:MAG: (d)CMP kinase [Bacteroidaceae bacterium]|nr:(d)CMP kinase [Bacteroidaceae bacterium]
MKKITIAIDGFSSCGKSTMAKALAKRIGYIYIDSGAMYRAATLYAIRHHLIDEEDIKEEELQSSLTDVKVSFTIEPESGKQLTCLNGEVVEDQIRSMEVSSKVSRISALPYVREAITNQLQAMGKEKGIVMDGRDIGTTVFPDAELKVFLTASAEIRAQRRYDELKEKGEKDINFDEILQNVKERDHLDMTREVSPLRQAPDAVVLDNSHLTHEEQDAWLLEQYLRAASE